MDDDTCGNWCSCPPSCFWSLLQPRIDTQQIHLSSRAKLPLRHSLRGMDLYSAQMTTDSRSEGERRSELVVTIQRQGTHSRELQQLRPCIFGDGLIVFGLQSEIVNNYYQWRRRCYVWLAIQIFSTISLPTENQVDDAMLRFSPVLGVPEHVRN